MIIKDDKETGARYIGLKKGKIARTEKLREWLLLDWSDKNEVLGVEILETSKHPIGISVVGDKLVGCFEIGTAPNNDLSDDAGDYFLQQNIESVLNVSSEKFDYEPQPRK